ncbi:MAG: peptidase C13 [Brevundimonas sp.]|uniref:C13 family peptidase n=1 Tax=Brevundimonas sp. TaxID=1871086 RepID=UPI00178DCAC4|nr:C13 family peptidase [Brevundimonas sp.]MBA4804060.1 peptidase C13 [Brevundimonas sp.]
MRGVLILWLAAAFCGTPTAAAAGGGGRFAGWTAAIVQADWRDGRGRPIEAFDNARRDLVEAFLRAGFARETMVDVSLKNAPPQRALQDLQETAALGTRGCLLYFTSHGAPDHLVFGETEMTPDVMANLVRGTCGARPTVVIVSACYSGQFVNALEGSNRMVLTAARRDRTSFGCGADERYPWFDGCVLESLPAAADFLALAAGARACVARKEAEAGVALPSEPQLFVGAEMQLRLPTLRFERPAS